jgi:hypothetical protein
MAAKAASGARARESVVNMARLLQMLLASAERNFAHVLLRPLHCHTRLFRRNGAFFGYFWLYFAPIPL